MHANAELLDDIIKLVLVLTTSAAAVFGALNHRKVKSIDKAVNGNPDPNGKTLRENVQELHDDAQVIKTQVTAAPPEGQAGS